MDALSFMHWVFTGLLLLLVMTCMVIGRGKIPVNRFFGIRIPVVMSSPEAWRSGHQAAVLPAAITFTASLICSLLGLINSVAYWGSVIAFAIGVVWIFIAASKAASVVGRSLK